MFYKPTTKEFRRELIKRYPKLKNNRGYMSFYRYLLFRSYESLDFEETTVIPHSLIAMMNGQGSNVTNFRSGDFLQAFKRDVLPKFEYSDSYSPSNKIARTVIDFGIPQEDYDLLAEHQRQTPQVFLESGVSLKSRNTRDYFPKAYEEAVAYADTLADEFGISEQARKILDHHNKELSHRALSRLINQNLKDAEDYVEALKGTAVYDQTLNILRDIQLFPKPVLRPVRSADRLFEVQPLIGSIKAEVRRILTKGKHTYELDLVSSQLAIIAVTWDVSELQEFLRAGESIWTHLAAYFGGNLSYKEAFKKTLYSIVYCAGDDVLLRGLETPLAGTDYTPEAFLERFKAIPLIASIIEAGKRKAREITTNKKNGSYEVNPIRGECIYKAPPSEMAIAAQAIELDILSVIYDLQEEFRDRFTIYIYSYDGLTVDFRRDKDVEVMQRRITEAVEARAMEKWGVSTTLAWEKL